MIRIFLEEVLAVVFFFSCIFNYNWIANPLKFLLTLVLSHVDFNNNNQTLKEKKPSLPQVSVLMVSCFTNFLPSTIFSLPAQLVFTLSHLRHQMS